MKLIKKALEYLDVIDIEAILNNTSKENFM